jgi:ubiquinone/menaquinone biosynthesis C-methylase UbiE
MQFYRRVIWPKLMDKILSDPSVASLRGEALAPARGRVLEIGFGTGLNLAHLPRTVKTLDALEPNPGMKAKAEQRLESCEIPHAVFEGSAEAIPADDGTYDAVISTMTLCTIPDDEAALAEIRRVLRPGGSFLFLEHGLAPDPDVQAWQERLTPFFRPMLGGCHMNRDIRALLEGAGFELDSSVRSFYLEGQPKFSAYFTLGAARGASCA